MTKLRSSKRYWYENVFGFGWPAEDDAPALVLTDIARIEGRSVHLKLLRNRWRYRFSPAMDVEDIFARIFGTGRGALHVMVTTAHRPIRCYYRGPNDSRDPVEAANLAGLLKRYSDRFKAQIRARVANCQAIEWVDCDDPREPLAMLFPEPTRERVGLSSSADPIHITPHTTLET